MNICVIGTGFTGLMTAISIKKRCPNSHVTVIDSPTEARNSGFGESTPGEFVRWFVRVLDIPAKDRSDWINRFLIETNSTIKYSVKFEDFTKPGDGGFYNTMRLVPDHRVIFNNDYDGGETPMDWLTPDDKSYRLFDLWYELYLQGRRQYSDFQQDMDPHYWFNEDNRINWCTDSFSSTYSTAHINSFETGNWLLKHYKDQIDNWVTGTVEDIEVSDNGTIRSLKLDGDRTVKAHFYVDCTGFKRIIAKRLGLKWREARGAIKHNAAIITANSYTDPYKEMNTYTTNAAQDRGWMFRIPLLDRKSYGYVFNSEQSTQDQILSELDTVSDPATRVVDPFTIKWNPGSYEDSWSGNYCLIGLSSSFVEAFEGSAIILQMQQIDMLTRFINNPVSAAGAPAQFSQHLLDTMDSISQRIDLSFGLAPRDNTDYWHYNHSVVKDINLLDIINDYRHSPHAMFNNKFLPWQDHFYYFTAIYYGIDMSSRVRASDSNTLALAEHYFANQSKLNKMRAQLSPREVDWFVSQKRNT